MAATAVAKARIVSVPNERSWIWDSIKWEYQVTECNNRHGLRPRRHVFVLGHLIEDQHLLNIVAPICLACFVIFSQKEASE